MGDVDIEAILQEMKEGKPPFKCPFCGKSYKTLSGISQHLSTCDKETKQESDDDKPFNISNSSPSRDCLSYTDAQKIVEFEFDGKMEKFSIYDALSLWSKEDYEASLPAELKEKNERKEEDELNKTPVCPKTISKKRKGLKFTTPKNPTLKMLERQMEKRERESAADDKAENKDFQPIDKKVMKLPEAVYREIEDYKLPPAPPMPVNYIKFVEKTPEELDAEVEYDMDEEDVAWLKLMNNKRSNDNLDLITEAQFELLMDRLEKESYFHVQSNGLSQYSAPVDDDAICCVCMDGEATNTNVILFCDLCNLAVHQDCYGVPYIPEGQWLCRRCLQSPSRSVECCLCPNRGGAFKQTDDGRWAHVVCGLWIPEVRFANTVFLEPIDSIGNIPPARWKLQCRVCRQRGVGASIQCHKNSCFIAFHVTCGLLAGLHMKMETVREAGPGGTSITVKKVAYCDQHTPADSDAKPKLDDVAALGISTPNSKRKSPKKLSNEQHPLPILFRGLMNFSPQCPWDKVQKISMMVQIDKKNQFIQRLMAYWTLKRQTRNGVPLIRRLQFAKASKSDKETPLKALNQNHQKALFASDSEDEKSENETKPTSDQLPENDSKQKPVTSNSTPSTKPPSTNRPPSATSGPLDKTVAEFKKMSDERRRMRRLRHDLERVRLLCELIRKREQRKREILHTEGQIKQIELNPFMYFLGRIMELLQENDTQEIFAEPVDTDDVQDYLEIVKKPMDFSTMRKKLENFEYSNIDLFEEDFMLMVGNCLSYNEKDTIYYRAGTKMRDIGGSIIRQARRQAEMLGFDQETGLQLNEKVSKKEDLSDDKLMKEIDEFLNDDGRDDLDNDEHLKQLLILSDKADMIHHPSAKKRRQQMIKVEIQKLRRKISIDKMAKKESKSEEQPEECDVVKKKVNKKKVEKKRKRDEEEETEVKEEPKKKRKVAESEDSDEKSKKKSDKSPQKPGTGGVNRRNAILFTRKKAAQSEDKPDKKEDSEKGDSSSRRRRSQEENAETERDEFEFNDEAEQVPPPKSPKSQKKKVKGKGGKGKPQGGERDSSPAKPKPNQTKAVDESLFQTYRQGAGLDTDTDTGAESSHELLSPSSDDESESDSGSGDESYAGMSAANIQLEPLDLVWAKCRGYPWYPALIINPKMPRTGYFHNGVPIPVPPVDVLSLAESHTRPHYLILFFDNKRTWQWLPRDKLEPLGVDTELDKSYLIQSKKPSERKAVKKAYEEAILHRCRVTGETVDLSKCNSQTDKDAEENETDVKSEEKKDSVSSKVEEKLREKETPTRRKDSRDSKDSKSEKKEKEVEDSKETKDKDKKGKDK